MVVLVEAAHPLLDRQYQNKAMEWDLGYADRVGGCVSLKGASSTGVVVKNRTTESGSLQCLPQTCFAEPGVFVSPGELRLLSGRVWTGSQLVSRTVQFRGLHFPLRANRQRRVCVAPRPDLSQSNRLQFVEERRHVLHWHGR